MRKIIRQTTLLAMAALALSGCGGLQPSVVASLDDVTSESDVEGKHGSLTQSKSIALNGLLPTLPGDLCYQKTNRSISSSVCFAPGKETKSFYRTRTMGDKIKNPDKVIAAVRDKIAGMVHAAEQAVEAKLALAQFDVAQAERERIQRAAKEAVSPAPPGRDALLDAVRKADETYAKKIEEAEKAITDSGTMVFRWHAHAETLASGSLGTVAGASVTRSKDRSGFAIVVGLRASQLYLGGDIQNSDAAWPQLADRTGKSRSSVIPTTVYQAKRISYFSEMERLTAFQAQLTATVDQLSGLVGNPAQLAMLELDLKFSASRMYKVGNAALLGGGSIQDRTVHWDAVSTGRTPGNCGCAKQCDGYEAMLNRQLGDVNNEVCDVDKNPDYWPTFYQVGTQLKDLRALMDSTAATP